MAEAVDIGRKMDFDVGYACAEVGREGFVRPQEGGRHQAAQARMVFGRSEHG